MDIILPMQALNKANCLYEDLCFTELASDGVNDRHGWAGVIDEELVSGAMRLPHHQFEMPRHCW